MQRLILIKPQYIRIFSAFVAGIVTLTGYQKASIAETAIFSAITELDLPVAQGAQEPSLSVMNDGRIVVGWTEPAGNSFAFNTSIGDSKGWSEPNTVVRADSLFVNWADFPSVTALPDGTLAAHWLTESGAVSYAYDVNIALSADEGKSWGEALVPHRDGTASQHGFVTLLPVAQDRLMAIWLDGRAYDTNVVGTEKDVFTNATQLRATIIGSDGSLSHETLLDARTCTCCQTSASVTDDGIVLVVYRDRTGEEVRDISLVRLVDGVWSEPATLHADRWEISGCPVNGPAIDTHGERAVVAWFTAANGVPAVKVAFSDDAGESFGEPIRVDQGDGIGRVDVLALEDGSALVSWVEWIEENEALFVCRTLPKRGCRYQQMIVLNEEAGSINFPRMVLGQDGIYISWTQPLSGHSTDPELYTTIRLVLVTL